MVTSIRSLTRLQGTPVVPGLALGPALVAHSEIPDRFLSEFQPIDDAETALTAYDEAAAGVAADFLTRSERASGIAAEVLVASAALARDKGMRSQVRKQLGQGDDLVVAVANAVEHFAGLFTSMGGLMAERVTDLRDIGGRVTARIVGAPEPGVPVPSEPSVLVAADLAPADTASLDASLILALVTERGGPTSHTAIIARQLGIPCVVGVVGAQSVRSGTNLLVDGTTGTVDLDPDADDAAILVAADAQERAAVAAWSGRGATHDGVPVKLMANVADAESSRAAAEAPVEGAGLFRTELCFLNRATEPTVEEQAEVYAGVLDAFHGQGCVVARTLDAGSDKPIAYATHPGEANPALGIRGLRLAHGKPDLLVRQLDALALAAQRTGIETWVMAPMVATVAEAADFAAKVRDRGLSAGVMVEVPSAALQAARLLEVVDFLSIGTNDLTQYTMAADRMAADLAHLTDPWQPAVLQLVAMTARAGQAAGKPVGVCGEAAADPLLACVLVGLGVTSLSMAPAAVRAVGARLATVTAADCARAAEAALAVDDADAARRAVRALLTR